jgi:hypothetical protein
LDLNGSATIFASQNHRYSWLGQTYSGTLSYEAEVALRARDHSVGLRINGFAWAEGSNAAFDAFAPYPQVSASARIDYQDEIKLFYRGTGPIPSIIGDGINLNWVIDANLSATLPDSVPFPSSKWSSWANATFGVQSDSLRYTIGKNFVFGLAPNGLTVSAVPGITVNQSLSPDYSTSVRASLILGASTSIGQFSLDVFDTMKFESITFSDGTTPESHGFDIVLASGMASPNATATANAAVVPEPSSGLILMSVCLVTGSITRRKRLRRKRQ